MKPYKGKIDLWERSPVYFKKEDPERIGNLGYVIRGVPVDCPDRSGPFMRTSLVVKDDGHQIETLNSIYDLLTPARRA